MSSVLPYQSRLKASQLSSREFEEHFEQEMARRLRRRFIRYCSIVIAMSVTMHGLEKLMTRNQPVALPQVHALTNAATYTGLALYAVSLVWAWRMPAKRDRVLSLALWLYIIANLPGLLSFRLAYEMIFSPFNNSEIIAEQERQFAGKGHPRSTIIGPNGQVITTAPPASKPVMTTTRPAAVMSPRMKSFFQMVFRPGFMFGVIVPFVLFFNHLLICLFMPWSLREALKPAIVVFAIVVVFLTVDVVAGQYPVFLFMIFLFISAMAFVPGTLWCWWRFSAMRTNVKLRFESDKFHKLQSELAGARRILETSLPWPRSQGPVHMHYVYEPMRQIGGDLLFIHEPGDAMNIVLLDVTGHGIAAALTVNRLIGELERLYAEDPDSTPDDVLVALNRYVYYTMSKLDMFVSAIAARIDPQLDQLLYANAGHPTAFVRRAGGAIEPLESTAVLLGVEDAKAFSADSVAVQFHPGDAVILYTDGASEARSAHTQLMLGINGVKTLIEQTGSDGLNPDQWPAEIMRRVAAFRSAVPDDDTLVATVFRPTTT